MARHADRSSRAAAARHETRWVRLLLLLPFIAVLGTPSGLDHAPVVLGVVCAYWYQALWVLLSAGLIYTVYRIEN